MLQMPRDQPPKKSVVHHHVPPNFWDMLGTVPIYKWTSLAGKGKWCRGQPESNGSFTRKLENAKHSPTGWCPSSLAKLVNISPISLWFLLVIYRTSYWDYNPFIIGGGTTLEQSVEFRQGDLQHQWLWLSFSVHRKWCPQKTIANSGGGHITPITIWFMVRK
jgi:hypothetical protein